MSSLIFPDINVWLALLYEDHVHRRLASEWWNSIQERIAFNRFTQMGLLRLSTTAAAMNGQPLTMNEAWRAYDRLFEDDRVVLLSESVGLEVRFRELSRGSNASPKLWADAYLLAFAAAHGAQLVTFDRALANRGVDCIVLR